MGKARFYMMPDISLTSTDGQDKVIHILDTKWKRIDEPTDDINQNDMYQLYSYGKKYNCQKVALIYPQTDKFTEPRSYHFDKNLSL